MKSRYPLDTLGTDVYYDQTMNSVDVGGTLGRPKCADSELHTSKVNEASARQLSYEVELYSQERDQGWLPVILANLFRKV
jgi:hypothetical protein